MDFRQCDAARAVRIAGGNHGQLSALKPYHTQIARLQPAAAGRVNAEKQTVSQIHSLGARGKQGPAD